MRTKGRLEPYQIRWEEATKVEFVQLIQAYDRLLSINGAINKLVDWAIKEHWLPGYERHSLKKVMEVATGDYKASASSPNKKGLDNPPSSMVNNKNERKVQHESI